MAGCPDMGSLIRTPQSECASCSAERSRRHRVLSTAESLKPELQTHPIQRCTRSVHVQRTQVLRDKLESKAVCQAEQCSNLLVLRPRCASASRRSRVAAREIARKALLLVAKTRPRDRPYTKHISIGSWHADKIDREYRSQPPALQGTQGPYTRVDNGARMHSRRN